MNISIPISIDMLNSNKGMIMSNSEYGINESAGNRSFMNYLLCHSETEQFSIPDSRYKNNDMDSYFYGDDDFSKRLNISLQALSADSLQTQVTEGEGTDSKIMPDNRPEIPKTMPELTMKKFVNLEAQDFSEPDMKEPNSIVRGQTLQMDDPQIEVKSSAEGIAKNLPVKGTQEINAKQMSKVMPELITKDLTKSPVPDTLIVDSLEITASSISGANETMDKSTNLRKGYETHMLYGSINDNENNPLSPLFSKGGNTLSHPFSNKGTEVFSDEPHMSYRLIKVDENLSVETPDLSAGQPSRLFREAFSDENQKASDFINHGKDGFNYAANKTAEDSFSHMFYEHSQNKNNPVASEVVTAARRIIDMPDNRFHIISRDATSVEVSVEPEEIGRLDIKLSMDKDAVKAKITAFEYAGKEVMERNIYNIVDSLVKDGINISGFSVSLKDRRDNQNNSFTENKPEIAKQATERQSKDDLTENSTINIFI